MIYFDLFDMLLKLHKPNSGGKNEGLIRSISGNSNIPVVHQFYKLENLQLKAKKNEVNFSYRFSNLNIRCFCTFRLAIIFTEVH